MKRRFLLTTALASLLIFGGTQANGKDIWTKVQTRNFTLLGNAGERDLRKIAIKLETFRETLSLMFPKAKITTAIPTTVVIFKSDDAFRPFKPRYQGKIRDNVAGYFLPGLHMNYIVLSAERDRTDPYEVIFHEYEHCVLRNNLSHIPAWLDEGLAEFYSSFQTTANDQKIKLGIPLPQHVYYLRNQPLLPLTTLLTVDRRSPHYNENSKAGAFYATSWALVHYLMNGKEQKRQPQLIKFIDLVNAGAPAEESFRTAFQTDFGTIERELRGYVNRWTFPVLDGTFHRPLNFDREVQSSALSEAEVQYYQGDLLLNQGQIPEAKVLLEKSVVLDGHSSRGLVALGILRMIEQQTEEAGKLFEYAVECDPGNYLAHFYRAETLAQTRRYEEAIESYKKAISLKSDIANLFDDLGYAYVKAGKDDDAIKAFEDGLRVNPRAFSFYRTLAYLHLRRGNGEWAANNAYRYLWRVGWRDDHSQYMALAWYFALKQTKRDEFAAKTLRDSIAKVDSTEWPFPVLQFLNHTLTLTELLAQANDNNKLTEVHAYAGLELSAKGETQVALEHLRWVTENGNKNFVEYPLALAEIERLERVTVVSK